MQFIVKICYNSKDKKEKQRKNIKKAKEGKEINMKKPLRKTNLNTKVSVFLIVVLFLFS